MEAELQGILGSDSAERVRQQLDAGLQVVNAELGGQVSENTTRSSQMCKQRVAVEAKLWRQSSGGTAVEAKLRRSNERIEALSHTVRRIQAQNAGHTQSLSRDSISRIQASGEGLLRTRGVDKWCAVRGTRYLLRLAGRA